MVMRDLLAGLAALTCASQVVAIPGVTVGGVTKRASCAHGPTSRQCWGDYDINTDYATVTPETGVTREYWLSAQEVIAAPDGYQRQMLVFNGTSPGPAIEADWGDWIVVHVKNDIPHNGTAVHWHGIRMLNNNENDGVPGVTQCGIVPGDTMTYKFRAQQYDTSWYHSHFSYQAVDGLSGPIIIYGPATANYDEHLGALFLTDWGHTTATETWMTSMMRGLFPLIPNGLINGTNTYECGILNIGDKNCKGTGKRFQVEFEAGKKYRMGLVGTQADGFLRFSMDGHKFTVIAMDFVPIEPFEGASILIGGGQRYDIVVHANQPAGNYWMRSVIQACNVQLNENSNNIKGIITYKGVAVKEPTTNAQAFMPNDCYDQNMKTLIPKVKHNVGTAATTGKLNLQWFYDLPAGLIFHWTLNSTSLMVDWANPTLKTITDGSSVFPTMYNVHPVTVKNKWVYWVIQDLAIINAFHPVHLHGHDFYVLGQGKGLYVLGLSKLNTQNPPRGDTAILPGNGWMVMAFYTDNPGAWLMHCHIAWHASQGFALQFVEREGEISSVVKNTSELDANCKRWETYEEKARYEQDDSGI